jgi:hypothetical protein
MTMTMNHSPIDALYIRQSAEHPVLEQKKIPQNHPADESSPILTHPKATKTSSSNSSCICSNTRACSKLSNSIAREKAHASMIRSKFLHRLGFSRDPARSRQVINFVRTSTLVPRGIRTPTSPRTTTTTTTNATAAALLCSPPLCSSLRKTPSCSSDHSSSTAATVDSASSFASTSTSSSKKNMTVSFRNHGRPTEVHGIPGRLDYSHHRRQMMWISAEELQQNYARNVLEFQSEHWDYRQCVEEEQFVRNTATGELVHPIHAVYWLQQQQQQQQLLLRQQEQQYRQQQYHHQYGSPPNCGGISGVGKHNLKQHFCRVLSAQQRL